MNRSYYIVKQAMSPAMAALISSGIGAGIGYGIDSWRAASGNEPENRWIGPLLMATVASTPAIFYGMARHNYDTDANGKHSIPFMKRWLMNDKDFWDNSRFAMSNYRNKLLEYESDFSDKGRAARDKARNKQAAYELPRIGDINVNAFNQETWMDASRGRTPLEAAATTTNFLNQTSRRAGSNLVSPGQVINTMVNAGIGYGTAWLAGKTLGALAGVSPATQQKLQEIGTWGGMLSGIHNASSLF